jgi:hypothetical protein
LDFRELKIRRFNVNFVGCRIKTLNYIIGSDSTRNPRVSLADALLPCAELEVGVQIHFTSRSVLNTNPLLVEHVVRFSWTFAGVAGFPAKTEGQW